MRTFTILASPSSSAEVCASHVGGTAAFVFLASGPYVLARAFGGPVLWRLDGESLSGGDTHHYQLGAGTSVATGGGSMTVDLALLGERGLSLGVAVELR